MSVAAHLPALQVVVPLVAAPLTVLLRGRRAAFAIVLLACWVAFAIAVALWLQVNEGGTISYHIGSWPPPWGIEYRVDRLVVVHAGTGHRDGRGRAALQLAERRA